MSTLTPSPIALRKSFGFGDRLGLATPGHLAAAEKHPDFTGIFAQQSIRELARTDRTAGEVMTAAQAALGAARYEKVWGADADHLKTPEDVQVTAAAGFTFFTIDPSSYVNNAADSMEAAELNALAAQIEKEGITLESEYVGKRFDLETFGLEFSQEVFRRAAVKYGRALAHAGNMAAEIRKHRSDADIEISVDETETPTRPEEHLFIANELQRRGVPVVSLAPRFIGEFEKGIDFKGDLEAFESELKKHVEIARTYGPYKISVHSGSDKFSIYPVIGRCCEELLHVKTAGTSYLEALRAIARVDPELFAEIADYSITRFATDRATYHISTTEAQAGDLAQTHASGVEHAWFDTDAGRQVLHVTFGSVLTKGRRADGSLFHGAILEFLRENSNLHAELLCDHFDKHLRLLKAG